MDQVKIREQVVLLPQDEEHRIHHFHELREIEDVRNVDHASIQWVVGRITFSTSHVVMAKPAKATAVDEDPSAQSDKQAIVDQKTGAKFKRTS